MDNWRHADDPLPLLGEPADIRRHALSFRTSTSFGSDSVHPRQVALLSDGVVLSLIRLYALMLPSRVVAATFAIIIIRLIPKADGGDRPIGLFTAVLRVLHRALRR